MDINYKLKEIQDFSESLNRKLYLDFGCERVEKLVHGGNLFLGKNYTKSESDKIFMTFNPGKSEENNSNFNTSLSPCNRYWDDYKDKEHLFWNNSRNFFKSQPSLRDWISDATSTFLIPWRTNNIASFRRDPELSEKIFEYSGRIICRMLEHHQAKIIVVSGITTLKYLSSEQFLNFDLGKSVIQSKLFGKGSAYQCRMVHPNRNNSHLIIFQTPHFSRANSSILLHQCSEWLWNEVVKLKL